MSSSFTLPAMLGKRKRQWHTHNGVEYPPPEDFVTRGREIDARSSPPISSLDNSLPPFSQSSGSNRLRGDALDSLLGLGRVSSSAVPALDRVNISPDSSNLWQRPPQSNSPGSSFNSSLRSFGENNGTGVIPPMLSRLSSGSPRVRRSTARSSQNEITLPAAASFFRTYFSIVHPQYPFLDIQLCSEYYTAWRRALPESTFSGWPAFFVNMIFAIGSLIESKSEDAPYFEFQDLKSRAQAEQSIMADSTSSPLIRLQAMLLSAMFALYAENTWRIAHISGAIMKFASLHRFHRLTTSARNPDQLMSIRAWSCAYVLDRAVSSALGSPVSLPDVYIRSPLFEETRETSGPLPWLSDCDSLGVTTCLDLRTFSHICKVRSIQSHFMHIFESQDLEESIPVDLEMRMLENLREWESPDAIACHSVLNSEGYHSSLWLEHIGHLTRLSICQVNKSNIFSSTADTALRAGCEACKSFRSLQKKKQIAQPWLVVISQFRAAVTLWYIIWARAISIPREIDDALRDCSSVLAIFAEKWPKAELYRDCFELLASSIPRSQPLGHLPKESRDRLVDLLYKLEESGIHRTTSRMLWEMGAESGGPRDNQ